MRAFRALVFGFTHRHLSTCKALFILDSTSYLKIFYKNESRNLSSIHARVSAASPSVLGIPALTAFTCRCTQLLHSAGPSPRGHASSIQVRVSAAIPSVLGSPALTAFLCRCTQLLHKAGPRLRGHASSIQASVFVVSASTLCAIVSSVLVPSTRVASSPVICRPAASVGVLGAHVSGVARHPLSATALASSMCLRIVVLRPQRVGTLHLPSVRARSRDRHSTQLRPMAPCVGPS